MTTIINGSSPSITFSDSTTQTTAFTTTPTINTITSAASTALTLQSAGTTAVTIDTNQFVGVGTTPSSNLSGVNAIQVGARGVLASSGAGFATAIGDNMAFTGGGFGAKYLTTSAATMYYQYNGTHNWFIAPSGTAGNAISYTQAMTLDGSGNLLVGTTSNGNSVRFKVQANGSNVGSEFYQPASTSYTSIIFTNPSGTAGSITTNLLTTTYATTSDYRLKENVAPMTGALAKVSQLKPVTYKWKNHEEVSQGFIAHELAEVCPDAVVGKKDAVDENDNPQYQSIDTSFLVATLTAAIQELNAKVDAQATTIAELQAKVG
jgi:hypothetical protein